MDMNNLLATWKLDEIPACDKGMGRARKFLTACGEGVSYLGVEKASDRAAKIRDLYMDLVAHPDLCPNCSEAESAPLKPQPAAIVPFPAGTK
jgi:hypothetical protein